MKLDGINGTSGVPLITGAPKFEFTETQFRMIQAQVKKMVGGQGGQVPISDPFGAMAIGIVMDKLNDIAERLDRIEARLPAVNP